jgi:hypothetical protein
MHSGLGSRKQTANQLNKKDTGLKTIKIGKNSEYFYAHSEI